MSSTRGKRALSSATRPISPPPAKRKVQSATTKSAVANFFKPASEKEPERTKWRIHDGSVLVGTYSGSTGEGKEPTRTKVAGFDLDSTLIITQSGNTHAKNETDWKWWHSSVPLKVRELHNDGYKIVIFTNQGGLKDPNKNAGKVRMFKNKVAAILNALDVPLHVYAATGNDRYRKPRTGMWEKMKDDLNLDVHGVSLTSSFLVGDAAGRKGDFSDSDMHWAMNVGIQFHTPEEFFLGEEGKVKAHRFDPSIHLVATDTSTAPQLFTPSDGQEIVLFVGSPGSGKSTFYRKYLEPLGLARINQDTLKSREKCLKVARGLLAEGKSIAIDNTNADIDTRALWISLATKRAVPIRCVWFTTPAQLAQHNDAVRAFAGVTALNPENRQVLPKLAFTNYISRFKEPALSEGFTDLMKVDFAWQGDEQQKEIWRKYWI